MQFWEIMLLAYFIGWLVAFIVGCLYWRNTAWFTAGYPNAGLNPAAFTVGIYAMASWLLVSYFVIVTIIRRRAAASAAS